jgi:hypothetical protein
MGQPLVGEWEPNYTYQYYRVRVDVAPGTESVIFYHGSVNDVGADDCVDVFVNGSFIGVDGSYPGYCTSDTTLWLPENYDYINDLNLGENLVVLRVYDHNGGNCGTLAFDGVKICGTSTLNCPDGFEPPMRPEGITVKKNRTIPFKAALYDNGDLVTELVPPPVIEVTWVGHPAWSPPEEDGLSPGQSMEGNLFEFIDGFWQFNLSVKKCCSAKGEYIVTMESGNIDDYEINPTPTGSFVVD